MYNVMKQFRRWIGFVSISPLLARGLLTAMLVLLIAAIDIFFTPTLHVGVFLYPVAILSALWWGGERGVVYITLIAWMLTLLEQWSNLGASYNDLQSRNRFIGAADHVAILLLLLLFGSACIYIARQQAKYQHAQESLTDLEAKLTSVIQLTPDALVLANTKGHIVFWNAGAKRMFGYTEEEALGQSLTMIMPSRYREDHLKGFRRVCETGATKLIGNTIEVSGLRKSGVEFPVELSLASWQSKGERFFSAFLRDLTERKRMETRQAVQLAISQVLMESETVEQAGSRILHSVGRLTDWEVGLIWLLEPRTDTLRCATVWEKAARPLSEVFLRHSNKKIFQRGM